MITDDTSSARSATNLTSGLGRASETEDSSHFARELISSSQTVQLMMPNATNKVDFASVPYDAFPFEKLPAELRHDIIKYVLPQNLSFRFKACRTKRKQNGERKWNVEARRMGSSGNFATSRKMRAHLRMYVSLIRVKAMSQEARAIFFDRNEISLYIDGHKRGSSVPMGPFGLYHSQALLRDMRNIRLVLNINESTDQAWGPFRGRLQQIVRELRRHSEEPTEKSRLKNLTLGIARYGQDYVYDDAQQELGYGDIIERVENCMFIFEALTELRHNGTVKKVKVTGVPLWFAKCLKASITGRGGDVFQTTRHIRYVKRWYTCLVRRSLLTDFYDEPIYDWKEFAERNGIAVPADIGRFWGMN
ncbi:uncharacterized protein K460DRAFT_418481 [Cucurbitaria berberidis CBS 394.84]|uniref:Uncharacterized protein n=1 Tax=Cucurbitaria berberidis CBS 394.84 TaxID=1168544 RepID=A0A9P4GCL2_9PLEO|nr:uncharacterized protein K460DRAFT_418481 [Cucurbitaria berberidis CBS 394.84]KAF1843418.1 hypothetical protein K460DRAFT_418481 [Cucurbitaria berberidis CBS 394.84]